MALGSGSKLNCCGSTVDGNEGGSEEAIEEAVLTDWGTTAGSGDGPSLLAEGLDDAITTFEPTVSVEHPAAGGLSDGGAFTSE